VRRSQYSLTGTFQQKISLAQNRFLQAGKRAENTKEKSRQCLTGGESKVGLMDKIIGLGVSFLNLKVG
jgi:hypothetical protein